jgi:DNA-binding NarL/FixJ family response regulator
MKKITILIADDYTVTRQGLRALLETSPDVQVVGEAENGYAAIRESRRLLPNIVLMDIAMPLLNGLEATRQITRTLHSVRAIVLSVYHDDHYLRWALHAGAAGYLRKQATEEHLFEAIRQVHQGNPYFSPTITARLVSYWEETVLNAPPQKAPTNRLTSRQTEILQLVSEGYSTKEIAALLSISVRTVQTHRQMVMNKLDIHGTAALTRYAASNGVVEFISPSSDSEKRSAISNAPVQRHP